MAQPSMTGAAPGEKAAATSAAGDVARLLIRVNVSALILFHTYAVIMGEQAIRDTLTSWGLPAGLAWSAVLFEGLAPILVILGVYARLAAALMVFWMVMALLMAHVLTGHFAQLAANGVGWRLEGQFFFLIDSLAVVLLGAGRYGLGIGGRWN